MRPGRPLLLLLAALGIAGCPTQESIGSTSIGILGKGVINDPRNKSLRFDVLKFGLERFCSEMLKLGTPLKLADDQPVLGRFFADGCHSQVIDDEHRKSVVVQYSGKGYAWTAPTGRMGFQSSGLIEYAPDFQMHDGAMYIFFRPKKVDATTFQLRLVESALARAGAQLLGVNPEQVGRNIAMKQLERGFTVIRRSSTGETEFGMGTIPLGQRPFHPFSVQHPSKLSLANDRTEIHQNQQDLIGSFEITDDDQALYVDLVVDGAPSVDVFVLPKGAGDVVVEGLTSRAGPAMLPAQPLLDDPAQAGPTWRRFLALPKGQYFLMFDHSAGVGRVAPPNVAGDDRAARIDDLVQVGEAP